MPYIPFRTPLKQWRTHKNHKEHISNTLETILNTISITLHPSKTLQTSLNTIATTSHLTHIQNTVQTFRTP